MGFQTAADCPPSAHRRSQKSIMNEPKALAVVQLSGKIREGNLQLVVGAGGHRYVPKYPNSV
jgi:hypothetical protein